MLFVGLKLTNVIDWSWWWVLLPLYGGLLFAFIFYGLVVLGSSIYSRSAKGKKEIDRFNVYQEKLKNKPKSRFQQKMKDMMDEAKSRQDNI